MKLLKFAYEKINKRPAPYYYDYSPLTVIKKPLRKWITNVVAYNCPFNCVRILLYRLCGFDIGKRTFIGMHCYLDDLRYDLMHIGNDVIISYGVYFACHGRNQVSQPITIKDGAYVGMRATIISKNAGIPGGGTGEGVTIGEKAVVGSCALVNRDVPPEATAVGIPCRIIEKTETVPEE